MLPNEEPTEIANDRRIGSVREGAVATFPFFVVFPQCEDTEGRILTAWSASRRTAAAPWRFSIRLNGNLQSIGIAVSSPAGRWGATVPGAWGGGAKAVVGPGAGFGRRRYGLGVYSQEHSDLGLSWGTTMTSCLPARTE